MMQAVVFGASGAIGRSFVEQFLKLDEIDEIHAVSRQEVQFDSMKVRSFALDYFSDDDWKDYSSQLKQCSNLSYCVIASGVLHGADFYPERSLNEINAEAMAEVFRINCVIPAIILKNIASFMSREKSVIGVLSARVGSISDNRLGGWYSYRSSKSALNMLIKTASIELKRLNPKMVIMGLHPGTVKSNLSDPFTQRLEKEKLFSSDYSTAMLIEIIKQAGKEHSGKCFAYDGSEIEP